MNISLHLFPLIFFLFLSFIFFLHLLPYITFFKYLTITLFTHHYIYFSSESFFLPFHFTSPSFPSHLHMHTTTTPYIQHTSSSISSSFPFYLQSFSSSSLFMIVYVDLPTCYTLIFRSWVSEWVGRRGKGNRCLHYHPLIFHFISTLHTLFFSTSFSASIFLPFVLEGVNGRERKVKGNRSRPSPTHFPLPIFPISKTFHPHLSIVLELLKKKGK